MMCFRDMTFCTASDRCPKAEGCNRAITPKVEEAAREWWGNDEYPMSQANFTEGCERLKGITIHGTITGRS